LHEFWAGGTGSIGAGQHKPAGGGPPFSVIDNPIKLFDRILAVDVRSMFLGLKYVIPEMMKSSGRSIVMTASTAALRGGPAIAPYVTSKHAVLRLMRATSSECAPLSIRVNAVNPGPIATNMMARASAGSGADAANIKHYGSLSPSFFCETTRL